MRKAISLLLAAMMLFTLPITSFGAAPAKPDVSVAVNNIKDETMEVAIQVGNGNFKSVGAVLEYDASKVKPMRWSTSAAIEVYDNGVSPAAVGWENATVIESVCPDNLSGKPAMAYRSGNMGYLYLGAEAAAAQTFAAETQVVTVRFAYVGDTKFDAASATVKFAQDDKVAFASPVKGSMIYQTEDRATGDYKFYYLNPLTETDGVVGTDPSVPGEDVIPVPPTVTPVPDGETANKGEANPDDFVSLTFYDWDNTLLGVRIVAKGGSLIDPNTTSNRAIYVNVDGTAKFTDAELAVQGVAPIAPEGNVLTGGKDVSGSVVTVVNKESYVYAGWVDYETGYSTPNVPLASAAGSTITESGQALLPLTNIVKSAVVKAAYDETTALGSTAVKRRYVMNHSTFSLNGANIETTITVKRDALTRRSVDGTVLVIKLRPSGLGETQLRIKLGESDAETYVVKLPNNAASTYSASNGLAYSLESGSGVGLGSNVNVPTSEMIIK